MPKIPAGRKLRARVLQVFGIGPSAICSHEACLDGLEKRIQSTERKIPEVQPVVLNLICRFFHMLCDPLIEKRFTGLWVECRLDNPAHIFRFPTQNAFLGSLERFDGELVLAFDQVAESYVEQVLATQLDRPAETVTSFCIAALRAETHSQDPVCNGRQRLKLDQASSALNCLPEVSGCTKCETMKPDQAEIGRRRRAC